MKAQLTYFILGLFLLALIIIAFYIEFGTKTEGEFISFNDGAIECTTVKIAHDANREQLAEHLRFGAEVVEGKIGATPGCVNYEFAKAT